MFRFKVPDAGTYEAPTPTYVAPTPTYSAPAAATGLVSTITWTTGEPAVSYTYTVAVGSQPTSTELGIALQSQDTQINALIADVLALRTALLELAADNVADRAAQAQIAADNVADREAQAQIGVDIADIQDVLSEGN